jgi:hypothetical protein
MIIGNRRDVPERGCRPLRYHGVSVTFRAWNA